MSARPVRPLPLFFILFGIVLLTVPFHLRPDNFIVDDGYFYPQIARHIVAGQGSTFNGIMLTNGYHPLWMIVCVLAAEVTSASTPLLQILGVVQDLLLLASVGVLILVARTAKLQGTTLGCIPLVFFGTVLGIWRLLETNLALALQVVILVLVVPVLPAIYRKTMRWRSLLLGVMFGLVMLARLDLLFFVFVVLVYQLLHEDSALSLASRVVTVCVESTIAAAMLAPYLLWNWYHFQHLVTISGAIKSTFPHLQHWALSSFIYPVVVAILLNATLLFKQVRTSFDTVCLLTSAAAASHMIFTLSFGELAPWYLTTGYLTVSLSIFWIADLLLRKLPSLTSLEPVLAIMVFLVFLSLGILRTISNFTYTHLRQGTVSFRGSYVESKHALASKLHESLPAGSRIVVFDAPGGVAFYSGMNLLPVDGLVADYNYNYEIVQHGFARYAADRHIDYFIAPFLQPGQTYNRLDLQESRLGNTQVMTIKAPLTRQSAGQVIVQDKDLVFRFRNVNPELERAYPEIGLWRIDHAYSQLPIFASESLF